MSMLIVIKLFTITNNDIPNPASTFTYQHNITHYRLDYIPHPFFYTFEHLNYRHNSDIFMIILNITSFLYYPINYVLI